MNCSREDSFPHSHQRTFHNSGNRDNQSNSEASSGQEGRRSGTRPANASLRTTQKQTYKRKARNICPNINDKIFRLFLNKLNQRQALLGGKLGPDIIVYQRATGKEGVRVYLSRKCSKSELIKFCIQVAKNYSQDEICYFRDTFLEAVDKSILAQKVKMGKDAGKEEDCLESIVCLESIKQLLDGLLVEGVAVRELIRRVFSDGRKTHNPGVAKVQSGKMEDILCDLNRSDQLDCEQVFDVLQLGRDKPDIADVRSSSEHSINSRQ